MCYDVIRRAIYPIFSKAQRVGP